MDKKTMLNLINDLENDEMNNSTAKITIRRIDAKKIV
jgi:hypothetical protein